VRRRLPPGQGPPAGQRPAAEEAHRAPRPAPDLRQGRAAEGARARLHAARGPLRLHRQGRLARGTQGRQDRALLRPRPLAPRPQDGPARRLPARLPLPTQLPPGGQLGPPDSQMAAPILVAGLDSRSLFLEAPVLLRDRAVLEEKASARELLDGVARESSRLVILGTHIPDVDVAEAIRRIRALASTRRV